MVHRPNNLLDGDRLSKDAVYVEIGQIVARAGHNHDRNVTAEKLGRKVAPNRHAVHMREPEIEYQEIGRAGLDQFERVDSVPRLDDIKPIQPKCRPPHHT